MKLYIPFNMIVDTDVGVIRVVERLNKLTEYPINKLKSFLLRREDINPVPEYCKLRGVEMTEEAYGLILTKGYPSVLKLSKVTDILAFVINTYKLGLSNEMEITIGCDMQEEIDCLMKKLSKLDYSLDIRLNSELNLNDFDYIFNKYIDENYVKDLLENKKISGKRLYISDHDFNVLIDGDGNRIIDLEYHVPLESNGIVLSLISIYNKPKGNP